MRILFVHPNYRSGGAEGRPRGSPISPAAPPPESLFVWYAAVFTRLYRELVAPDCTCRMIEPDVPCDMARSYAISPG